MTEEKNPFSFGASFTAPSVEPTPAPEPVPSGDSLLDQILALDLNCSITAACSREESDHIYSQTRGHRQAGKMRIKYEEGNLTATRVKE